jgi:hypothetical protein
MGLCTHFHFLKLLKCALLFVCWIAGLRLDEKFSTAISLPNICMKNVSEDPLKVAEKDLSLSLSKWLAIFLPEHKLLVTAFLRAGRSKVDQPS